MTLPSTSLLFLKTANEQYNKHHREYYQKNKDRILIQQRISQKKYRLNHKGPILAQQRKWRQENKMTVFSHYAPDLKCQHCGFDDIRTLSIDHINGGGNEHRRHLASSGGHSSLYRWLIKNNFPVGFQLLCRNCQAIKVIENGECKKKEGEGE